MIMINIDFTTDQIANDTITYSHLFTYNISIHICNYNVVVPLY